MISRRMVLTAGAAVLALPAPMPVPAQATDRLAPFRRGVGIHHAYNWGEAEPDKSGYRWPPFNTAAHTLRPGTFRDIKAAGFDFIRLTVDPGVLIHFAGPRREEVLSRILGSVREALENGLGVVVDLHGNSQLPQYDPAKVTASSDSELFRNYQALVVEVARALVPLAKQRVALEPMNEPQWGWDTATTERWQRQQKQWHDAIRAVAPDLTLVLTGARGGDVQGLINIDPAPYRGSKVLWSFHYYEPYLLTHQGVKASEGEGKVWRYFSDLPYPAVPELFEPVWALTQAKIAADRSLSASDRARTLDEAEKALRKYLDMRPGRAKVAADFARLDEWCRKNEIPTDRLFLGEFGITRTYGQYNASPPRPLANWLGDVRQAAEKRNIGWSLWVYSGYGGMSLLAEDGGTTFDPATLRGLGLTNGG